jgi:hypothetical protein
VEDDRQKATQEMQALWKVFADREVLSKIYKETEWRGL